MYRLLRKKFTHGAKKKQEEREQQQYCRRTNQSFSYLLKDAVDHDKGQLERGEDQVSTVSFSYLS